MGQLRAPAPLEVIVLRHGRTAANGAGVIPGQLDVALDPVGCAEAQRSARELLKLGIGSILTSDLARAQDTAAALGAATGLPWTSDRRLRETYVGNWQGLTREQAQAAFPEEFRAWWAGHDVARGGGETEQEVGRRAAAAVHECLVGARLPVVVVTHAGAARALIGTLLGLPVEHWRRLSPLANGGWSRLGRDHLGWQLLVHNETAVHDTPVPQ
ncbi:MAG TPA: histidine phosphatase family protein [Jatrophihabitans sp.]|nr:histidine phosphatase family protein [Jatrophihabitans sp.]